MMLAMLLAVCGVVNLETGAFGRGPDHSSCSLGAKLNLASLFDQRAGRSCSALRLVVAGPLTLPVPGRSAPESRASPRAVQPRCTLMVVRADPSVDAAIASAIESPVDQGMVVRSHCSN